MIQVGDTVQTINKPDSCCGVLQVGCTQRVKEVIVHFVENLLILEDDTPMWEGHVQLIKRKGE